MSRLSAFVAVPIAMMVFVGCGGSPSKTLPAPTRSTAAADAQGKTWQWLGTVTAQAILDVKQPHRYTITLRDGGRAEIQADCNRGNGNYQIGDGTLSFSPIMSTRAACPPDSQDSLFVSTLMSTARFYLESKELNLVSTTGVVMRFKPAPAPSAKP